MSPKYFLVSERLNWNRSQLAWAGQKLALQLLAQKLCAQSGAMGKTAGNKELKHGLEVVSGQWLLLEELKFVIMAMHFFLFFFYTFWSQADAERNLPWTQRTRLGSIAQSTR